MPFLRRSTNFSLRAASRSDRRESLSRFAARLMWTFGARPIGEYSRRASVAPQRGQTTARSPSTSSSNRAEHFPHSNSSSGIEPRG